MQNNWIKSIKKRFWVTCTHVIISGLRVIYSQTPAGSLIPTVLLKFTSSCHATEISSNKVHVTYWEYICSNTVCPSGSRSLLAEAVSRKTNASEVRERNRKRLLVLMETMCSQLKSSHSTPPETCSKSGNNWSSHECAAGDKQLTTVSAVHLTMEQRAAEQWVMQQIHWREPHPVRSHDRERVWQLPGEQRHLLGGTNHEGWSQFCSCLGCHLVIQAHSCCTQRLHPPSGLMPVTQPWRHCPCRAGFHMCHIKTMFPAVEQLPPIFSVNWWAAHC